MEDEFTHLPFEIEGQWYTVCAEALCVYRDQHCGDKEIRSHGVSSCI